MSIGCRLIDAASGQPVLGFDPMAEGCVFDLARLPTRNVNIEVLCAGPVGSLRISCDGLVLSNSRGYELHQPWLLAGNHLGGAINAWTPRPGRHALLAQPFAGTDGRSGPGNQWTLNFTVR